MGTTLNEEKKYVNQENIDLALQALKNQQAVKPGQYQSPWQSQISDMMDKILNREQFNYDLNGDALYQQYKDQHVVQGQQAMMDTMGQAQAMTGGYGNSYAQTAGQQAYQGQLQQLNDKIPELYQLALSKYNQDGQNMLNQYGLMADQENQEYGRYQESLSNWQNEYDRLLGEYYTERNFGYQQNRDQAADAQWQKEFDEAVRQWNQKNGVSTGGSSSGGSTGGGGTSTGGTGGTGGSSGWLNSDGTVNINKINTNTEWWRSYASKNGLDPKTGKKLESGPAGGGNGFTGSTYSEAAAYLKSQGISASGLMTQSEWQRHKNGNNSAGGEHEASSYKEYLAAYIYGKTAK